MGVFEHFPYANFHELNISWILRKIEELEDVIGSQIVDLVARAGVAKNAQAIADLTTTVETNAETAHTEAATAQTAAAAAQSTADAAQTLASTANTRATQANTKIDNANQCVQIFGNRNLPTTETSYECDWSSYRFLAIEVIFYTNVVTSIIIPKSYFETTSSTLKATAYTPTADKHWDLYKDTDSSIFIKASAADAERGLRIYGINKI